MGLPDGAKGVNLGSCPYRSGEPQSSPSQTPGLEDLPRFVLFGVFHKESCPSPTRPPPHKLVFSIIIFVMKVIG